MSADAADEHMRCKDPACGARIACILCGKEPTASGGSHSADAPVYDAQKLSDAINAMFAEDDVFDSRWDDPEGSQALFVEQLMTCFAESLAPKAGAEEGGDAHVSAFAVSALRSAPAETEPTDAQIQQALIWLAATPRKDPYRDEESARYELALRDLRRFHGIPPSAVPENGDAT